MSDFRGRQLAKHTSIIALLLPKKTHGNTKEK